MSTAFASLGTFHVGGVTRAQARGRGPGGWSVDLEPAWQWAIDAMAAGNCPNAAQSSVVAR
jgi:hypothetical protein